MKVDFFEQYDKYLLLHSSLTKDGKILPEKELILKWNTLAKNIKQSIKSYFIDMKINPAKKNHIGEIIDQWLRQNPDKFEADLNVQSDSSSESSTSTSTSTSTDSSTSSSSESDEEVKRKKVLSVRLKEITAIEVEFVFPNPRETDKKNQNFIVLLNFSGCAAIKIIDSKEIEEADFNEKFAFSLNSKFEFGNSIDADILKKLMQQTKEKYNKKLNKMKAEAQEKINKICLDKIQEIANLLADIKQTKLQKTKFDGSLLIKEKELELHYELLEEAIESTSSSVVQSDIDKIDACIIRTKKILEQPVIKSEKQEVVEKTQKINPNQIKLTSPCMQPAEIAVLAANCLASLDKVIEVIVQVTQSSEEGELKNELLDIFDALALRETQLESMAEGKNPDVMFINSTNAIIEKANNLLASVTLQTQTVVEQCEGLYAEQSAAASSAPVITTFFTQEEAVNQPKLEPKNRAGAVPSRFFAAKKPDSGVLPPVKSQPVLQKSSSSTNLLTKESRIAPLTTNISEEKKSEGSWPRFKKK